MALEHVEVLVLLGFLCFGLVIFQQGINSSLDSIPTVNFSEAWRTCLKEIKHNQSNFTEFDMTDLPVYSFQGILYCRPTKTVIGYHTYREYPENWYDMDARRCDAQNWCNITKGQDVETISFAWTCDGSRSAIIWQNHVNEKCPKPLPVFNKTEATQNCKDGKILELSKMWLCTNPKSYAINELAWIASRFPKRRVS